MFRRCSFLFQNLSADARHAVRMFRQSPGFALVALAAIALGISATTTVFSLFDAVLLHSLPFGDAGRLVYMWTPNPRLEGVPLEMSPPFADVLSWRQMSRSITAITAVKQEFFTLPAGDAAARVGGARVLGNFFQTLQAAAQLGRTIGPSDDQPGRERVAVISDALWRSRFGATADVLGKPIATDVGTFHIVGVMPPEFSFPHDNDYPYGLPNLKRTDIWIPVALSPKQELERNFSTDAAIGRLRPGVTLRQAQAEMSSIQPQLDQFYPPDIRGFQSLLVSAIDTTVGPVRPLLRLLMTAVCLVLLIACANTAGLLMARAALRVHELGVRTALGAGRARLVRQMLTESLVLSSAGGALGVVLSWFALHAVVKLSPGDIPRLEEASLNLPVLWFALATSASTGLLFGMLPAWSAARVNVSELLRQGGRGIARSSARARHALTVVEVALAVLLLAGAGLLLRSYRNVMDQDCGFASSTLTMRIDEGRQQRTPQQTADLFRTAVGRVRALPGVRVAGAITNLPLAHNESMTFLEVDGYPNRPTQLVNAADVSGEYFQAMQIRLLAGRYLRDSDIPDRFDAAPQSVVVSQSFARLYFAGRNPVGARIRIGSLEAPWKTIVGVAADVHHTSMEKEPQPTVYSPSWFGGKLAIQSSLPPSAMIASIRQILRAIDPGVTPVDIQTMEQRVSESTSRRRFQTVLLVAFAVLAVLLALVGLYGLLSYSVNQRTPEIGVRMALGATRAKVLLMVVREGLTLTAVGLAVGLAFALALTRLTASMLFGVGATDPATFVLVPALVMAVAAAACFAPAWKATRIDPVAALREQ